MFFFSFFSLFSRLPKTKIDAVICFCFYFVVLELLFLLFAFSFICLCLNFSSANFSYIFAPLLLGEWPKRESEKEWMRGQENIAYTCCHVFQNTNNKENFDLATEQAPRLDPILGFYISLSFLLISPLASIRRIPNEITFFYYGNTCGKHFTKIG